MDYCEFFRRIEENPNALAPKITVREFLEAREHLYNCDVCYNRSERVLAKEEAEQKEAIKSMFNRN